MFDFPLNFAIVDVIVEHAPATKLGKALSRDFLFPRPDLLVTFLDNHDTPRLASSPGVSPARHRLAAAFLLTTRGIPQLTWGDEIGMPGHRTTARNPRRMARGCPRRLRLARSHARRAGDVRGVPVAARPPQVEPHCVAARRWNCPLRMAICAYPPPGRRRHRPRGAQFRPGRRRGPCSPRSHSRPPRHSIRSLATGRVRVGPTAVEVAIPGEAAAMFRLKYRPVSDRPTTGTAGRSPRPSAGPGKRDRPS